MEDFQETVGERIRIQIKKFEARLTFTENPSKKRLIGCYCLWIARYVKEGISFMSYVSQSLSQSQPSNNNKTKEQEI